MHKVYGEGIFDLNEWIHDSSHLFFIHFCAVATNVNSNLFNFNLIVRVWGFSAYFNDLPEEYKEYIIERALRSEGKIA